MCIRDRIAVDREVILIVADTLSFAHAVVVTQLAVDRISVSYTHLDVYKRQMKERWEIMRAAQDSIETNGDNNQ